MDLISIIIVTYNSSKYLEETLSSVQNQVYQNYEVIIIDDGSTDGTTEILNKYSSFSNYRIIFENHTGNVGKIRNQAVKISKGNYITFLDSDDTWHSDKLQFQAEMIQSYDMICSNVTEINESSEIIKELRFDNYKNNITLSVKDLLLQNIVITSSVLMKKDIFLASGSFDEEVGIRGEDYILWLNVAKDFRILFSNLSLVNYRIHNNNLSWKNDTERIKLLERTLEIRKHFISVLDIEPGDVNPGYETIYAELTRINYNIRNYGRSFYYSKTLLKIVQYKFSIKYLKYITVFIFLFMITKIKG